VPKPFRTVWILFWISVLLVFAGGLGYLLGFWDFGRLLPFFAAVGLVVTWAWRLVGNGAVINSLGDAARYLTPRPSNIKNRQAIRTAAVDLLDALHQSGEFDRVIVVGHSLGSVIAYDAITYYWIRVHASHLHLARPFFRPIRKLERCIGSLENVDKVQRLQFIAWKWSRRNGQPWLVTDLITLGSPLAHGDFLMARRPHLFDEAKAHRKLPTCPPVTETEKKTGFKRITFEVPYADRIDGTDKTFTVLHHAAPFSITRWTNLYFPSRLRGDPVGGPVGGPVDGPLKGQFGPWVKDVPLTPPKGGFVHTYYWRPGKRGPAHLDVLRATMRLDSGREILRVLAQQRPISLVHD
jgi:pimeloyl-ACP methyl ester carboxylesterase